MLWLILSLSTALAVSSHDAWLKKYFSDLNPYQMAIYPVIYSIPLFTVSLFFIKVPPLDAAFYRYFLASIPLNAIGFVMYMQAIRVSPLSLTVPYLAFTPVFMIATGYLFLDEIPNLWGVSGILATCVGGYILNVEPGAGSIVAPFKAIMRETGSWLMLIVAFIYSITAVIGKGGIIHSSPLFFTMSFFAMMNACLFVFLTLFNKIDLKDFRHRPLKGLIAGVLFYLHALFHGYAIALINAAYMISIKRFSILISVCYGRLIFKESNIIMRFLGAALMLTGAIIIILKGL